MASINFFGLDHMGIMDFFDLVEDLKEYAKKQNPNSGE